MEYKVHVNSCNSASIELRIKVLSSQLSSLFRVKVSADLFSGKSNQEKTRVEILSNPIKVISKLVHPKKENAQKKTSTELIEDAVFRLENQNAQNAKLISLLCQDVVPSSPSSPGLSSAGKRSFSTFTSDSEQEDDSDDGSSDYSSSNSNTCNNSTNGLRRTKRSKLNSTVASNSSISNNTSTYGSTIASSNSSTIDFESAFRSFVEIISRNKFSRDRNTLFRRMLHSVSLSAEEHSMLSNFVDIYSNVSIDSIESTDSNVTTPDSLREEVVNSSFDSKSISQLPISNSSQILFQNNTGAHRSLEDSSLAFPSPAPEQLHLPFNSLNNSNCTLQGFSTSSSNCSIADLDIYRVGLFSELESIDL